ncbi:MAG: response regulator [Aeriscardovia sp.]|nr:response regulator [Aeriscardovia sp.]
MASSGINAPRRVLVAEDEPLIRLDIVQALKTFNQVVVGQVNNGKEAVEVARREKPDVVLMDVKMPGGDGISATKVLSEEKIAPVVILTAYSQQSLVAEAIESGAGAYIVKPFEPEQLLPAIEIAISRFDQLNALESQITDIRARVEVRKKVDRAKGLLMESMNFSEPEAFRWIQKNSMDKRLSMAEVAEAVILKLG